MKSKIILVFLMSLYLVVITECGQYYTINNSTYYISYPGKEAWHLALRSCAYMGMSLIDFIDKTEEEVIASIINDSEYVNETASNYWISGTDLQSEGNFYWITTGHVFIDSNWMPGQPDNIRANYSGVYDTQNCVAMASKHYHNKWDDLACNLKYYYICRGMPFTQSPLSYLNLNKPNVTMISSTEEILEDYIR